jgi:hypothetical protein
MGGFASYDSLIQAISQLGRVPTYDFFKAELAAASAAVSAHV